MIKSNELRIGNYLYDSCLDVIKIECIMSDRYVSWDEKDFNLEFSYESDDINMFHPEPNELCPIQLTDEILSEWCGFKISPCQGFYFDVDNELQIYITRNHAISLINRQDEGEHYLLRKIGFLHQLQNLYFAFTGEELTVNLPKPAVEHINKLAR